MGQSAGGGGATVGAIIGGIWYSVNGELVGFTWAIPIGTVVGLVLELF